MLKIQKKNRKTKKDISGGKIKKKQSPRLILLSELLKSMRMLIKKKVIKLWLVIRF